jgi:quercetin dioxygenase-like cupin family protein
MTVTRHCLDLDREIELLTKQGYRLDMITPADSPREIQLSKNDEIVRLVQSRESAHEPPTGTTRNDWVTGRAGMMYRDLLPGRLGGRLIASHIRLTEGGPIPDYVHYHKIDFQLIYCLKGRIRVVYEDQGEPFWLEPGDCVLQPPEIRHRVLEAEAGSEVLELSSPAEHETWVEHEITLPTAEIKPDRRFGGQRFVRSIAKNANWTTSDTDGVEVRDLSIFNATKGLVDVCVRRAKDASLIIPVSPRPGMIGLGFVVAGREKVEIDSGKSTVQTKDMSEPVVTRILTIEFRDTVAAPLVH